MNRSPRPRFLPEKPRPSAAVPKRYYEGGDTIPRPADPAEIAAKSHLLERFREKVRQTPASELHTPERYTTKELGAIPTDEHPELPVRDFKERILHSVAHNQVTIITAETGAGKSTQVPQYLIELGYHVSMTQPRRISASFVAERIQDEVVKVLGADEPHAHDLVGYHTAERNTTVEGRTRIEVVTDGLRLVQEFGDRDQLENEVLIIDEVHEWNSNIEMLIARAKQLLKEKPELRVLIMSATMEAERLASYFEDVTHNRPEILSVPGRNHEVERIDRPDSTVADETVRYVKDGENVLVFLPGLKEIEDTEARLETLFAEQGIKDVTILQLHSKMSQVQQDAVRYEYAGPKVILATNIAQTSITIPDVNVVIDSGLERRTEIDNEGTVSLKLRYASRADLQQRAGRTGRVAPGTYILTRLDDKTDFEPADSPYRNDYPVPEILRTDVDRNTLIAAAADIDFEELELFHPVDKAVINRAKTALYNLNALDEEGKITNRGVRMNELPMRPKYARMVIESQDLGYSVRHRAQVAAMVAAIEVGGLPSWLRNASRDWRTFIDQVDSDHIAQLELMIVAQNLTPQEQQRVGLDVRNVERAQELKGKIARRTALNPGAQIPMLTPEDSEPLRRVVAAGLVDFAYGRRGVKEYVRLSGTSGQIRTLTDRSTVAGRPRLLVATPYGVEKKRRGDLQLEHIIQDATVVTPQLMAEVALNLTEWQDAGYEWRQGKLKQVQRQLWQSVETLHQRLVDPDPTPEAIEAVVEQVLAHSGPALKELKDLKKNLEQLQHLTPDTIPVITQDQLIEIIREAVDDSIFEASHVDTRIRMYIDANDLNLKDIVGASRLRKIRQNAPKSIDFESHARTITYRSGTPYMKLANPNEVLAWKAEPRLPDGREIKIIVNKRSYTFEKLRSQSDTLGELI